ncbi:hypothetical protein [Archaeoglobus sulfaticallidus]|nr:hypothetical protein [Archaeoglobus sulfaticallidus]
MATGFRREKKLKLMCFERVLKYCENKPEVCGYEALGLHKD